MWDYVTQHPLVCVCVCVCTIHWKLIMTQLWMNYNYSSTKVTYLVLFSPNIDNYLGKWVSILGK
jgi:hypothetical protein